MGHRSLVLVFGFCVFAELVGGDNEKVRKCDPHSLKDCPDSTTCTESGECRCWPDFIYNVAHEKNASAEYCIYKPSQHPATSSSTAASGSASSSSTTSSNSSKSASANSQHEPPGVHHLVGGILIPVLFVLAALGVVYSVKRLNLIRRAREAFTRRNRPFYEDVMMGNDNDDPPLI